MIKGTVIATCFVNYPLKKKKKHKKMENKPDRYSYIIWLVFAIDGNTFYCAPN